MKLRCPLNNYHMLFFYWKYKDTSDMWKVYSVKIIRFELCPLVISRFLDPPPPHFFPPIILCISLLGLCMHAISLLCGFPILRLVKDLIYVQDWRLFKWIIHCLHDTYHPLYAPLSSGIGSISYIPIISSQEQPHNVLYKGEQIIEMCY